MRILTTASVAAMALALSACGGNDAEVEDVDTDTTTTAQADAPMTPMNDASAVDFGDDSGEWANDGECDDARFEGEGLTDTQLLEDDIMTDATDCRTAYEAGTVTLRDQAGV